MKIIFETYQKSKNKSINTVRVEYDGKVYHIDPDKAKVKLGTFALTASLVITAVAYGAPKIKNVVVDKIIDISNDMEEHKYAKDLEKSLNHCEKTIIDCISIPVNPETKSYDYNEFYEELASNAKKDIIHLDAYIKKYGENSVEINNIIRKMTGSDTNVYLNLNDYLKSMGFETYEDFRKSCLKYYEQKYFSNFSSEKKELENNEKQQEILNDNIVWVKAILESENPNIELYKVYLQLGDSDEMNEIITKISFMDKETYNNLEEYIIFKGFTSIEEWKAYCISEISKNNEERKMQL